MISKLFTITFVALVSAQIPEQFPAGVDPAKCPNFPICDNAFLHNSQAVPRTFSSEPSIGRSQPHYHPQPQPQQHHHQSPQQQYSPSPSQQYQHQPSSVPVSHRNTVLPSSSFGPVPAPAHVSGSYQPIQHQSSSQESSSQWTLKNLRFDSDDYYQAPQSNHLPEPIHRNPPPPPPPQQQQQQQQNQFQYQHQYQPQPQHQHQHQYQHQQQYASEQNRNYSPESESSHNVGKTPPGGDKYPAGVDATSCPNYPYCGTGPSGHQGPEHAAAAPLPGFTERLYPAGVNPQQCANFPYCFE